MRPAGARDQPIVGIPVTFVGPEYTRLLALGILENLPEERIHPY